MNFNELDSSFCVVTETWLSDGETLAKEAEDLLLGSGISMFTRNRAMGAAATAHGGIAIMLKDSVTKFSEYKFINNEGYEVLPILGKIAGIARKFLIVAVYIPPGYNVARGRGCLRHVSDIILDAKDKLDNPYICIAGDFNQWLINETLEDYPDLVELQTPATRKDRRIDRVFVNWENSVNNKTCLLPLESLPDREGNVTKSDHKIQAFSSELARKDPVIWETYRYRPFTAANVAPFQNDLAHVTWDEVYAAESSELKAATFQQVLNSLMDKHFPMKTSRRKASDLPWINDVARKRIKKKKIVFKEEGKSPRWVALRDSLDVYLERRRLSFLSGQRDRLTSPEANKQFYKNVSAFKSAERPKQFDVRELLPQRSDLQRADEIAGFFNAISREFEPLAASDVPSTYNRPLPLLSCAEVENMLLKAKKPNSMVVGDLFPALVSPCAGSLSLPLTNIFNAIIRSQEWPIAWKREYVTVIPKKKLPESLGDLRNISCTLFFSKVFEKYVLQCAMEEVSLKTNQFGGVKGCSTTHMIIELLQQMCENSEDYRSATVLTAVDYSKAFNRLSYQHCLKAFQKKGASNGVIRLIASFLSDRTMTVRVGQCWSSPLPVSGGCPQGSILGVFLFNLTTDDLEDDYTALEAGPLAPGGGRGEDITVAFLDGARNVPLVAPPVEEPVGTQVLLSKPVKFVKYVDDNVSCEKLNFGNIETETDAGTGLRIKRKCARKSQNAFLSVTSNAGKKGLIVNEQKTSLLCVSDSLSYTPLAFITDSNGSVIECKPEMKVLGFYLTDKPSLCCHVRRTIKSFKQRYWVLRHLKKLGFLLSELVQVYKSVLLPLLDYGAPAYHSMLTDELDYLLEAAQVGALRVIFGYGLSGRKLREIAGIETLRERRISQTDRFANACVNNMRFQHWFPRKVGRASVRNSPEQYQEFFARCDRLRNSPLFYMRRRLNGKAGKEYGERYRFYRE